MLLSFWYVIQFPSLYVVLACRWKRESMKERKRICCVYRGIGSGVQLTRYNSTLKIYRPKWVFIITSSVTKWDVIMKCAIEEREKKEENAKKVLKWLEKVSARIARMNEFSCKFLNTICLRIFLFVPKDFVGLTGYVNKSVS